MQLVTILMNNKEMDLGELSISYEFINPLFSENNFNTGYTFSHSLPYSSRNKSVLGYKNRLDVANEYKYSYKLLIGGFLYFSGIAKSSASQNGTFQITVISDGVNFVQKAERKLLKDIPMEVVTVFDESDSEFTKLNNWYNQINKTGFPNYLENSHLFPMIWTAGYNGDYGDDNAIHWSNHHVVNSWTQGDPDKSWNVYDTDKPGSAAKWWPFTVAPCPRIKYLIDTALSYFGITELIGDLWENTELIQMIVFAGVVLDQEQSSTSTGSAGKINVHAAGYNLQDHVPDTNVLSLFQTLTEIFGATFRVEGSKIYCRTFKEIISKKPVDLTKFLLDSSVLNDEDVQIGPAILYAQENDYKDIVAFIPTYNYAPTSGADYQRDKSEVGLSATTDLDQDTIELQHMPMKCTFFITDGMNTFRSMWATPGDDDRGGFGELSPRFIYPFGISSLGDSKKNYRQQQWQIGCVRPASETIIRTLDAFGDPNPDVEIIEPWPYNHSKTLWDSRETALPFNHEFGESIYLADDNGTYENYLRFKYNKLGVFVPFKVEMNLPFHLLVKYSKFEEIKHILKTRNGSVVGYLEKISGTITQEGIGTASMEYRVPKSVLYGGDFNVDFSGDYSI